MRASALLSGVRRKMRTRGCFRRGRQGVEQSQRKTIAKRKHRYVRWL
jgi:hypothetical protein